jgi:hypothetical protein
MSTEVGRASIALIGVLIVLSCAVVPPAEALWPFTRAKSTRPDTVAAEEWKSRFDSWKERSAVSESSAATRLDEVLENPQRYELDTAQLVALAAAAEAARKGTPAGGAAAGTGTDSPITTSQTITSDPQAEPTADPLAADDPLARDPFATDPLGAPSDSLDGSVPPVSGPAGAPPQTGLGGPSMPQGSSSTVLVEKGFTPIARATLDSNNDNMRMSSSVTALLSDAKGMTLNSTLSYGETIAFNQNTESKTRGINLSLNLPLRRYGLGFLLSTANSKTNRDGTRSTGGRTSDASDSKGASASATFSHRFINGVGTNANFARTFSKSEQVIVSTTGSSAGARQNQSTGNSYGVGLNVDRLSWIRVRGRVGRSLNNNIDRSPSFDQGEQESTSDGDTASVHVELPLGQLVKQVTVDFQMNRSKESFTDVARTSSGSISNTTQFALETRRNFSRQLRINGQIAPISRLTGNFAVTVARDSVSYAIRPNQFQDRQRLEWSLGGSFRYRSGGSISLNYETSRGDFNRDERSNPDSPQTRREESRSLSGEIRQKFTPTLEVRAYGDISLAQGFYAHEGPQGLGDRDDLRTRIGLDINGQVSGKMTARVQMYVRTFDQAFIDPRRSSSSRDETEYVVRPSFTYQITPRFSLRQLYNLSSKTLDEIFDVSRNTLNRNHFVQTNATYEMTDRLQLDARIDYQLQDNGLYLALDPTTRRRIFAPTASTKKDEIGLGFRFDLIRDGKLALKSDQVATRERRTTFQGGRAAGKNVTERGNLSLGFESKYKKGDFLLDIRVTRNQSFNVTLNRNVFYVVDSQLSYTF